MSNTLSHIFVLSPLQSVDLLALTAGLTSDLDPLLLKHFRQYVGEFSLLTMLPACLTFSHSQIVSKWRGFYLII